MNVTELFFVVLTSFVGPEKGIYREHSAHYHQLEESSRTKTLNCHERPHGLSPGKTTYWTKMILS